MIPIDTILTAYIALNFIVCVVYVCVLLLDDDERPTGSPHKVMKWNRLVLYILLPGLGVVWLARWMWRVLDIPVVPGGE